MTDAELEQQARSEISLPLHTTLTEAYIMGARYQQGVDYATIQSLADDLMRAHENEDWQDVAHIALDVIPRMLM